VLGLAVLLIFYLGMVSLLGKMSPMSFLRNIREAQLLAFSTSSSAVVMPLSMETAEKKLSVEPSIARFIIPLGATINMDGTALYQVTAAVFLNEVRSITFTAWRSIRLTGSDGNGRLCESLNGNMSAYLEEICRNARTYL